MIDIKKEKHWITDNFAVRKMCLEYVDSYFEGKELLETMAHYPVAYDIDMTSTHDAIVVRLHVTVNEKADFPGYKIACIVQSDYLQADRKSEMTRDQVAPEDMEYFIRDLQETLQDHLIQATESMPIGSYILPPFDIEDSINKQIRGFLGGS